MINVNNITKSKIDLVLVKKVAERFLKKYKKQKCEVSIAFIGDMAMRRLNKKYRGIDRTTDVLSFAGEQNFLGEIVINYVQIKRQAKKFGNSIERELIFILVHGLLHLLGYDDESEKGRLEMDELGEEFVKYLIVN